MRRGTSSSRIISVFQSEGHNAREELSMLALYLKLRNLFVNEEGQDLIEYALLVVLIAVAGIAVLSPVGDWITGIFQRISRELGGVAT
jgi:Flp pilus assembly pilin Flp